MDGTLTDTDLSSAVDGDPAASSRIYRELAPKVLGYLTARGVEDAEAVMQDVFLALFGKLRSITGGIQGLRTLAFSIAHARAVDATRRRAGQPQLGEYDPEADPRTSGSAEAVALDAMGGDVLQLLHRLKPDQRDVLALRIVADLPIDRVAGIMGRSEGSVKQLQRRALANLKNLVADGRVAQ